jgi:aspartate racemase
MMNIMTDKDDYIELKKKCIGIVGGVSPESTIYYYQYITREYTNRFNDYRFPRIVIYSVAFQNYIDWCNNDRWDLVEDDLVHAITKLEAANADFGLISANTLHYVFEDVTSRVNLPLLSIVDVVSEYAQEQKLTKLALLGTKATMAKSFYPDALARFGIETVVPDKDEKEIVHQIIFQELSRGIILPESKRKYLDIINRLADNGADGVILGCTEIPLLIKQEDVTIPVLDSSHLHAKAALEKAIG